MLEPEIPPAHDGWGRSTFLSNDDSMSLSSAQRILFALERDLPVPREHVRKHEFLNYFTFRTASVLPGRNFSVLAQIHPSTLTPSTYTLAMAIASRPVEKASRRNVALTLVIDRSGSMRSEGRMNYLKDGLKRMLAELKAGDLVHMVTFDHRVCVPLQNFVAGRDDPRALERAIDALRPAGATNLHAGLSRGYALADASYQPHYTNRVLLMTDALANRGDTHPATLSMIADHYDARRIRLSGIGVGMEFNDALLDQLTERGRGAYLFLGSAAEVETVFGRRFTSLVETVANDVHFRLQLPATLRIRTFHGEESSSDRSEVQAVHVFADSSQLFLTELEAWQGKLRPQDGILLEVDYLNPETGAPEQESFAVSLDEMLEDSSNVRKGELLVRFVDGLSHAASPGQCEHVRRELQTLVSDSADPEIRRLRALWDRYCLRFPSTRPPRKPG